MAIAAFWRSPRLNVVGRSSPRSVEPEVLEQVGGVLLPAVGVVQPGDVLEVLPHREVVVEHRLVAEVAGERPRLERSGVVARRC